MSGRDELKHGRGVKARKINPSAVYEERSPLFQGKTRGLCEQKLGIAHTISTE